MAKAFIAPLRPPAVGELEHPIAPVEANDADGVAPEELGAGLWHRNHAAGGVHELLMDHYAGDEAVGHQVGLHLTD